MAEKVVSSSGNELREEIRREMHRLTMSQNRLARETGINAARLSQWMNGKYAGKNGQVEQELQRWLSSLQEREKTDSRVARFLDWKLTPTAEKIVAALRYAQDAGDISLVYGGAGVGKTCTAKRYQEALLSG